jgi:cancer susceptibility candidate protein 1
MIIIVYSQKYADQFGRESNENFQITAAVGTYRFGIWGNMTKNPRLFYSLCLFYSILTSNYTIHNRFKAIEFPELGMSTGLPKPLALANVAIRMLHKSDPTCGVLYEKQSKSKLNIIGGVLYFDLVELPEAPKKVDSWTIRQGTAKRSHCSSGI